MTKVPIDVMRDIRNESNRLRQLADQNQAKAVELQIMANIQREESLKLRDMADKWAQLFPETEDPLK